MWVLRCNWALLPVSSTSETRFLSWRQKFGVSMWESLIYSLISLILCCRSHLPLPTMKELRALRDHSCVCPPQVWLCPSRGLQDVCERQLLRGGEPRQLSSSWLGAADDFWKPWPTSKSPPPPPAHPNILHTEAALLQSAELCMQMLGRVGVSVCLSV